MGIQRMKLLTGTTVSLLLSVVSLHPAVAGQPGEVAQQQLIGQSDNTTSEAIRGTIKSIVGDVVTIQEANGRVRPLTVRRPERGALGLVPGMDIVATLRNGRVVDIARATTMSDEATSSMSTMTTTTTTTTQPIVRPAPTVPPPVRPAPTVRQAPAATPDPVIEAEPDTYEVPAQPVRALW